MGIQHKNSNNQRHQLRLSEFSSYYLCSTQFMTIILYYCLFVFLQGYHLENFPEYPTHKININKKIIKFDWGYFGFFYSYVHTYKCNNIKKLQVLVYNYIYYTRITWCIVYTYQQQRKIKSLSLDCIKHRYTVLFLASFIAMSFIIKLFPLKLYLVNVPLNT